MMEALSRFIEPVVQFPFSTGIHWLLMSFAGFFVANCRTEQRGEIYDKPRPIVISVCIIALWTAYEIAEFAQIQDNVSGDLANGLIAYLVGAFGTLFYQAWKRVKRRNQHDSP